MGILDDPVVNGIATKQGKTASQILLRFLVQQGVVCIPKSTNPTRLHQNIEVNILRLKYFSQFLNINPHNLIVYFQIFDFVLSDEEMTSLKDLDKGLEGRSFTARAFKGYAVDLCILILSQ